MCEVLLTLYSREGCCLCEGLEKRLRSLSLHHLDPPLKLCVVDIDDIDTPKDLLARYDLHVPVMLLRREDLTEITELPRVSPRLNSQGLFQWLQKNLTKTLGSD